jgi:hypothetical protein
VFPDADALELQRAIIVGHRNQAEIGGSTANITDQDNVPEPVAAQPEYR